MRSNGQAQRGHVGSGRHSVHNGNSSPHRGSHATLNRVMRKGLKLLIVLVLLLIAGACHKRTPAAIPGPAAAAPPPPPAPSCTLTAEPASVDSGQSVTVSWESHDATDVDLQPGGGKQQALGSTSVTPQESTTYTLALTGPGGKGSCSARVTVTPPPPAV